MHERCHIECANYSVNYSSFFLRLLKVFLFASARQAGCVWLSFETFLNPCLADMTLYVLVVTDLYGLKKSTNSPKTASRNYVIQPYVLTGVERRCYERYANQDEALSLFLAFVSGQPVSDAGVTGPFLMTSVSCFVKPTACDRKLLFVPTIIYYDVAICTFRSPQYRRRTTCRHRTKQAIFALHISSTAS